MKLTMRVAGIGGSGLNMQHWTRVWKYKVLGLPVGEQACLAEWGHRWNVLHVREGVRMERKTAYTTAQGALAALEAFCNQLTFSQAN